MKEKILNFTFCFFCFFALYIIFNQNKEIASLITSGLNLFFKRVFPSLFPMFILNDIFIYAGIPLIFYYLFRNLFQVLFHTSGICAYVFFMCLISGTPSSAYILKNLVEQKLITVEEAEHYLYFTYFSNPLFLTIMLSELFTSPLKIILIHYSSNFIIALLLRKKAPKFQSNKIKAPKSNLGTVINHSIKNSMSTLLAILGTIIFYMLLNFIILSFLPNNPQIEILTSGILEITNGLNHLIKYQNLVNLKEIFAISIISFGGLSIHTQVKSILEETPIHYLNFLKGRIMQVIISILLILIF